MFAWTAAVSLVLVLLLIWSALYRHGLLWKSEAGEENPAEGGAEPGSEPSREK